MFRATLARVAALLIIASQAIALWVALDTTGHTAIVFSFVGHPLLVAGIVLGIVALAMRRSQEARQRAAASGASTAPE